MRYDLHFGTISVPRYSGSLRVSASERFEPTHAFEPKRHDSATCRWCDRPESVHKYELKIAHYLTELLSTHRTLSDFAQKRADYWWSLLTENEKVLAYQILGVTGTRVW